MRDLIRQVQASYPQDTFFANVDETLRRSRAQYRAYDRAFSLLDTESWNELRKKAVSHFRDHRQGQLKQGFFHQLNDAFAYQYLLRQGNSHIRVLGEGNRKSPDLSYFRGKSLRHCEVKSIGISQEEIYRRHPGKYVNRDGYASLSAGFLNKLGAHLDEAQEQICSRGTDGLVFIVATFDDFSLSNYERCREQISEFLASHTAPEVYVKVGLIGGRRIHKADA